MTEDTNKSRRRFLVRSAAVAATPIVLPALQGCGGGSAGGGGGSTTPAGPMAVAALADLPASGAMHIPEQNLILVRSEDGGVGAFTDVCPHAQCAVHPEGEGFDCDCHGSSFDAMGRVQNPPARVDLEWYEVSIDGGQVWVDKDATVPTGTFIPAG